MNTKKIILVLVKVIYWCISLIIKLMSRVDGIQFLMLLDSRLYYLHGKASVQYGNGIHTKHQHMRFHDFFINRIAEYSSVLDIGCGNGCLTYDIAQNVSGVIITGVDIDPENIATAQKHHLCKNIQYIHCDATKNIPEITYDTLILSNVLEHIENRVEFLKKVISLSKSKQILIRVPVFERDWRVPLKQELGLDYRLDDTHYIEYTLESFSKEMEKANIRIIHQESRWGEIWAEGAPDEA